MYWWLSILIKRVWLRRYLKRCDVPREWLIITSFIYDVWIENRKLLIYVNCLSFSLWKLNTENYNSKYISAVHMCSAMQCTCAVQCSVHVLFFFSSKNVGSDAAKGWSFWMQSIQVWKRGGHVEFVHLKQSLHFAQSQNPVSNNNQ